MLYVFIKTIFINLDYWLAYHNEDNDHLGTKQ